ncbi:MAG: AMP-binding protein, partial [Hyphomicrobiales bacterium]
MTIFKSSFDDVEIRELTITECLLEALSTRLNQVVLTDGVTGETLTAEQLMDGIKSLAGGLTNRNLGKDHVIALMAPNMPAYAVVFHGVAWAGGTITTINPAYTEHEVRHQLIDSKAEILVTAPAFLETAKAAKVGTEIHEIVVIGEAEGATSLDSLMGPPIEEQVP